MYWKYLYSFFRTIRCHASHDEVIYLNFKSTSCSTNHFFFPNKAFFLPAVSHLIYTPGTPFPPPDLENINVSSDVEAWEGDVIYLHCDVDSHPTGRMTWSVDGRPLRHVTSNSDSYVIADATCSDNGEYVCDVTNDEVAGEFLSATTTVRIHCE